MSYNLILLDLQPQDFLARPRSECGDVTVLLGSPVRMKTDGSPLVRLELHRGPSVPSEDIIQVAAKK